MHPIISQVFLAVISPQTLFLEALETRETWTRQSLTYIPPILNALHGTHCHKSSADKSEGAIVFAVHDRLTCTPQGLGGVLVLVNSPPDLLGVSVSTPSPHSSFITVALPLHTTLKRFTRATRKLHFNSSTGPLFFLKERAPAEHRHHGVAAESTY